MDITYASIAGETAPSSDQIEIKTSATIEDIRSLGDGAFMKITGNDMRMAITSSSFKNLYSDTRGALLYVESLG